MDELSSGWGRVWSRPAWHTINPETLEYLSITRRREQGSGCVRDHVVVYSLFVFALHFQSFICFLTAAVKMQSIRQTTLSTPLAYCRWMALNRNVRSGKVQLFHRIRNGARVSDTSVKVAAAAERLFISAGIHSFGQEAFDKNAEMLIY